MIILIDNYDSFSYNLWQYIGAVNPDILVIRNDAATAEELLALRPSHIVLSPGPGRPADAGICEEAVLKAGKTIPLLGVCLGHQAICEAFGARIVHAARLMHGKRSEVKIDSSCPIFEGLPPCIQAGRYHSLAAEPQSLPRCLKVTAETGDGEIMAVAHLEYPIFGVQFHPESILTPDGPAIITNFLSIGKERFNDQGSHGKAH